MASRQTVYDVWYETYDGRRRVKVFEHREDAEHFAAGKRVLRIQERIIRSRARVLHQRRRRASQNPSTGAWLTIGLGVAALGIGAYFIAKSMSSSSSSSNPPEGPQLPPNLPPAPAGDQWITVRAPGQSGQGVILLSQACAAARALAANGNAADAAAWAQVCRSNGGTV